MGRPRKTSEARRDDRIEVRLTPAERVEFDARASLHGMTAAELVRHRVLDWRMPPNAAAAQAKAGAVTVLARLGTNLNQIARHMNTGHPASEDLHDLLRRIMAELDRLLDEEN